LFSRFLKLGFIWDRSPSLPRYFTRAYDGMLWQYRLTARGEPTFRH